MVTANLYMVSIENGEKKNLGRISTNDHRTWQSIIDEVYNHFGNYQVAIESIVIAPRDGKKHFHIISLDDLIEDDQVFIKHRLTSVTDLNLPKKRDGSSDLSAMSDIYLDLETIHQKNFQHLHLKGGNFSSVFVTDQIVSTCHLSKSSKISMEYVSNVESDSMIDVAPSLNDEILESYALDEDEIPEIEMRRMIRVNMENSELNIPESVLPENIIGYADITFEIPLEFRKDLSTCKQFVFTCQNEEDVVTVINNNAIFSIRRHSLSCYKFKSKKQEEKESKERKEQQKSDQISFILSDGVELKESGKIVFEVLNHLEIIIIPYLINSDKSKQLQLQFNELKGLSVFLPCSLESDNPSRSSLTLQQFREAISYRLQLPKDIPYKLIKKSPPKQTTDVNNDKNIITNEQRFYELINGDEVEVVIDCLDVIKFKNNDAIPITLQFLYFDSANLTTIDSSQPSKRDIFEFVHLSARLSTIGQIRWMTFHYNLQQVPLKIFRNRWKPSHLVEDSDVLVSLAQLGSELTMEQFFEPHDTITYIMRSVDNSNDKVFKEELEPCPQEVEDLLDLTHVVTSNIATSQIQVEVTVFGLDESVFPSRGVRLNYHKDMTFDEYIQQIGHPWEDIPNLFHQMISRLSVSIQQHKNSAILHDQNYSHVERDGGFEGMKTLQTAQEIFNHLQSQQSTLDSEITTTQFQQTNVMKFVIYFQALRIVVLNAHTSRQSEIEDHNLRGILYGISPNWSWERLLVSLKDTHVVPAGSDVVMLKSKHGVFHVNVDTICNGEELEVILIDAEEIIDARENGLPVPRESDDGGVEEHKDSFTDISVALRETFDDYGMIVPIPVFQMLVERFSDVGEALDYYLRNDADQNETHGGVHSPVLPPPLPSLIPPPQSPRNTPASGWGGGEVNGIPPTPQPVAPSAPPAFPVSDGSLRGDLLAMGFDSKAVSSVLEHCNSIETAVAFLFEHPDGKLPAPNSALVPPINLNDNSEEGLIKRQCLGMGFPLQRIEDALLRGKTLDFVLHYLSGDYNDRGNEPQRLCEICRDEVPMSSVYLVECPQEHNYCYDCIFQHVKHVLCGGSPHIPACPNANGSDGCKHVLTHQELMQIANFGTDEQEKRQVRKIAEDLYLSKAHRDNGQKRCPSCPGTSDSCFWYEPPPGEDKICVNCPSCSAEFCCRCDSMPYHYQCNCDEVMVKSREWMEWLNTGRDQYMRELNRQGDQFNELLNQYNQRKSEYEREKKAAEDRYQERVAAENWKQQNCKRCPHCARIVQKVDGCDLMICGQNYHGGDNQQGCGQNFRWTAARPYIAETGDQVKEVKLDAEKPELVLKSHFLARDIPMMCDVCQKHIVGLRIQCVNCASFNSCLQCNITSPHNPQHIHEIIE